MSVAAVLAPLFVQVALTFFLLLWMGRRRVQSIERGETRIEEIALGERNWPGSIQQIANSFHNQFEIPVLFYVLTALALITRKADLIFVLLAWIFVISRIVHVGIHVTSNDVRARFFAFAAGVGALGLMWLIFAVRILLGL
jgi:hypothetical protein